MIKAVVITRDNINYLKARFTPDEDSTVKLEVGYVLVAPFDGLDQTFELLTRQVLQEKYINTGFRLKNGFFEVKKR